MGGGAPVHPQQDGVHHLQQFLVVQSRHTPEQHWGTSADLSLALSACTVPQTISTSTPVLSFGEAALGATSLLKVGVTNHSQHKVTLLVEGVPAGGAFTLVNTPRLVLPGHTAQLTVQFAPTTHKTYVASLSIRAAQGGAPCPLHLSGRGLSPDLTATPADGALHFGHVLTGVTHRQFATVQNASGFPVPFVVTQRVRGDKSGFGAGLRFSVQPEQGTLAPGATQRFAVTFYAEEPTGHTVLSDLCFSVPQQPQSSIRFALSACAWRTPLFAFVGTPTAPSSIAAPRAPPIQVQASQPGVTFGCVTRSHELQASARSPGGTVVFKLPENDHNIAFSEDSLTLTDGELVTLPLHAPHATSAPAAAAPDGTVAMMQSVTLRGAFEFLPATDTLPDTASREPFWVAAVCHASVPL